jgi:hypothetical protein
LSSRAQRGIFFACSEAGRARSLSALGMTVVL